MDYPEPLWPILEFSSLFDRRVEASARCFLCGKREARHASSKNFRPTLSTDVKYSMDLRFACLQSRRRWSFWDTKLFREFDVRVCQV